MSNLFGLIRAAIDRDDFLISLHAEERLEEREITGWQVVAGTSSGVVLEVDDQAEPFPTVRIRVLLVDGSEVEAIWSWVQSKQQARLVTVYWPE